MIKQLKTPRQIIQQQKQEIDDLKLKLKEQQDKNLNMQRINELKSKQLEVMELKYLDLQDDLKNFYKNNTNINNINNNDTENNININNNINNSKEHLLEIVENKKLKQKILQLEINQKIFEKYFSSLEILLETEKNFDKILKLQLAKTAAYEKMFGLFGYKIKLADVKIENEKNIENFLANIENEISFKFEMLSNHHVQLNNVECENNEEEFNSLQSEEQNIFGFKFCGGNYEIFFNSPQIKNEVCGFLELARKNKIDLFLAEATLRFGNDSTFNI